MDRVRAIATAAWRRYRGWPLWAQIVVGLVALSILAAPFTSQRDGTTKTSTADRSTTTAARAATTLTAAPATSSNATSTTTDRPTTTARVTTTTTPPSQADVLRKKVADALSSGNRKVPRLAEFSAEPGARVTVKWAINENLTEGLTKDGSRIDGVKMLQAIRDAKPDYDGVFLEGTYSLVDRFGNTSEETVIRASYTRATVERINFSNFSFKNVYVIADSAQIHPSFQY